MPQFFMYTTPDPDATAAEPSPELFEEMDKLITEGVDSGWLVATGSLDPYVTKLVHRAGNFTLTDGPFTEAKELIVGWAIVKVDSKEEAVELSKRFWRLTGVDGTASSSAFGNPAKDLSLKRSRRPTAPRDLECCRRRRRPPRRRGGLAHRVGPADRRADRVSCATWT